MYKKLLLLVAVMVSCTTAFSVNSYSDMCLNFLERGRFVAASGLGMMILQAAKDKSITKENLVPLATIAVVSTFVGSIFGSISKKAGEILGGKLYGENYVKEEKDSALGNFLLNRPAALGTIFGLATLGGISYKYA